MELPALTGATWWVYGKSTGVGVCLSQLLDSMHLTFLIYEMGTQLTFGGC